MEILLDKINESYKFCLKIQNELERKNESATEFARALNDKERILAERKEALDINKKETDRILAANKETQNAILVQKKEIEGKNIALGKLITEAKAKEESLSLIEKSLIAREVETKKIEDVVSLSEETNDVAREVSKQLVELDTQRKSFAEAQDRVLAIQTSKATELADKEDNVKKKEMQLTEGRGQLEQLVATAVRKILKK